MSLAFAPATTVVIDPAPSGFFSTELGWCVLLGIGRNHVHLYFGQYPILDLKSNIHSLYQI